MLNFISTDNRSFSFLTRKTISVL